MMASPEDITSKETFSSLTGTSSARSAARSQRVLACVLCQQRKVKCDRRFPCANCIKAGVQCVSASLAPRQRRRRFPERELLDRLRHYEGLLREHNIPFDPLHPQAADKPSPSASARSYGSPECTGSGNHAMRETTPGKSDLKYESINFWNALNQKSPDADDEKDYEDEDDNDDDSDEDYRSGDVRRVIVRKAWDELYNTSNDHFLFGSRLADADLSVLHPPQNQIFKLWQIYLENVNPLLKVIHAPTMQARIIKDAGDMTKITSAMEALLFSVYCISVQSLEEDECIALFESTKEDLQRTYRFGCQQALLKSGFSRSSDLDCLTALYLYLVSLRPDTDPRSLSSMFGAAVRVAQRMHIHNEAFNVKCSILDAEMRRRLWWSIVMFDNRISEMSDHSNGLLDPTWDCKTPLNVNDFDLQPDMKVPPAVQGEVSEALFVVVRSEVGDFLRHSPFYLDFGNPSLKSVARDVRRGSVPEEGEVMTLENMIEEKYLKNCNQENPIHCMTLWTTRYHVAKAHLLEHYARRTRLPGQNSDQQLDMAVQCALKILECDTHIMTSPLTKGYRWLAHSTFPFIAYLHLVQDMKKRPNATYIKVAWESMSANYEVRFPALKQIDHPFYKISARFFLHAWAACEAILKRSNEAVITPRIISTIRERLAQIDGYESTSNTGQPSPAAGFTDNDFSMDLPMSFGSPSLWTNFGNQGASNMDFESFNNMLGQSTMEVDMSQLDWNALNLNSSPEVSW